jgi:hypothetical protein
MSSTAALMPGHYFMSFSSFDPAGKSVTEAHCECGHLLNWETRERDHAWHLLDVAWGYGYTAGDIGDINPQFRRN